MKRVIDLLVRFVLLALIWSIWWWTFNAPLSAALNLSIIVGGVLLVFPVVWLGRKILDRHSTTSWASWTTTFVHVALGLLFGVPIIRAIATHQDWPGWVLPVPSAIGLSLVILTGVAFLLTVTNLALRGFGAPFFIALSRKLAADWLYAWTRILWCLRVWPFCYRWESGFSPCCLCSGHSSCLHPRCLSS